MRGRPRFAPAARRTSITITIDADLRALLQAEATRAGASLSMTAERLIAVGVERTEAAERALLERLKAKFEQGPPNE